MILGKITFSMTLFFHTGIQYRVETTVLGKLASWKFIAVYGTALVVYLIPQNKISVLHQYHAREFNKMDKLCGN